MSGFVGFGVFLSFKRVVSALLLDTEFLLISAVL